MKYEILCTDGSYIHATASGRSGCYHAARKAGKTIKSYRRVKVASAKVQTKANRDAATAHISESISARGVCAMVFTPTCPKCYKPIVESATGKHCHHCGWGMRYMGAK